MDRRRETLAVAFNCAGCGGARVLSTTAGFVAAVLACSTANNDILDLGAKYIHCGEPMPPADPDLRSSQTPLSTQQRPTDRLEAYLRIRVLRCRCGFQMEKPRRSTN